MPGQVNVLNPEQVIACDHRQNAEFTAEIMIEKGLIRSKGSSPENRVDIGTITLDAIFTPVKRVSYEVENMRGRPNRFQPPPNLS